MSKTGAYYFTDAGNHETWSFPIPVKSTFLFNIEKRIMNLEGGPPSGDAERARLLFTWQPPSLLLNMLHWQPELDQKKHSSLTNCLLVIVCGVSDGSKIVWNGSVWHFAIFEASDITPSF